MKNPHWKLVFAFLIFANVLFAQHPMLEKKVTIQFFDVKLGDALEGISEEYDVNFSYSIDRISVHQIVSADVENAPLSLALEDLLEETDIVYASIGDQVVLKVDKEKRRLLSEKKSPEIEIEEPIVFTPVVVRTYVTQPMRIGLYREKTIQLQEPEYEVKVVTVYEPKTFLEQLEEDVSDIFYEEMDGTKTAQVTLFGMVGTNLDKNANTTNRISANILWGKNGGVEGTEVGGLVNVIVNDVKGIQVAGLGNTVGGDVHGTQVGGLFNVNFGTTNGVQAAGIINIGKKVRGVQAAGIMNVAKGSTGIQAAGIGNIAGRDSKGGMQTAPIFNINQGKTNLQVAALLNIGNRVQGCQIGLINIADSVGASIGLLNIVRNGYNRLQISGEDALYTNVELKLGSRKFYNIFRFGFRPKTSDKTWGLGYGIGTKFSTHRPRFSHDLELVATQMSVPNKDFGEQRNVLGQLRWNWDFRLGYKTSFFFGPTLNVKFSKIDVTNDPLVDKEIGQYHFYHRPTELEQIPVTFANATSDDIKMWVGINAGMRF